MKACTFIILTGTLPTHLPSYQSSGQSRETQHGEVEDENTHVYVEGGFSWGHRASVGNRKGLHEVVPLTINETGP